jgi:hypothetical protein
MIKALENHPRDERRPRGHRTHPHRAERRKLHLCRWRHQGLRTHCATTYVQQRQQTRGEWYLNANGHFCSFWPPSYRACYELRWIVEEGRIAGLRFTQLGDGSCFDGRYR